MSSDSERVGGPDRKSGVERLQEWFLLSGHRAAVAALIAGAVFAVVTAVGMWHGTPLRDAQPVYYAFSGQVSGNLTIITVVVSINQLLLNRELNPPNELRSQIDGIVEYREDVEDAADRIAPVEPLGFLRLLVETTRETAQRLGGEVVDEASDDAAEDIEEVISELTARIDEVDDLLSESDPSTFAVLSTTLTTNYARDINRLRRVRTQHRDDLPPHVDESIGDLIHQLQNIDVARQYFRGVYLKGELAALSRNLFYVGISSVVIVAATLLSITGGGVPTIPGFAPVVLSGVITIGFVPLIVLCAYILRSATVTRRTVTAVPFTVPMQER